MYIYHPYLLDKAQNSQPCSSCGLTSFWRPLPFGLRGFLKISEAFAVAQLTPQNHNRFSSVSGLGTRRCTADSDSTIPSAVALGQKVKSSLWVFRQARLPASRTEVLYPRHRVYLKEPKPPFWTNWLSSAPPREGFVLGAMFCVCFLYLLLVTIYYHAYTETSRKKSYELR